MKKITKMLLVIWMVTTTAVSVAQSTSQSESQVVLFLMAEEPYCEIPYDYWNLAELIASADTVMDEDRFNNLMGSFFDRNHNEDIEEDVEDDIDEDADVIDDDYSVYMDGPEQSMFLILKPHYVSKEEEDDYGIEAILFQFVVKDEVSIISFSLLTVVGWMDFIMEDQDIDDFITKVYYLEHQNYVTPR